jgi:tubulin beta
MVREVITIQVGGCGNEIGAKFWEVIGEEHGISARGRFYGGTDLQLQGANLFYHENANGQFIPRAVLADLEPSTIDSIRGEPIGELFRPENIIFGCTGGGNNWAKGYYSSGQDLDEPVRDLIRKEAERCDCLHGLQFLHSLGGGTGSGFGTLLVNTLRAEYPDRILSSYSLFPSLRESDIVVEPYNCILALRQLAESADAVFCFDNASLCDICYRTLKLTKPTFSNLNRLISMVMAGTTCSVRFPGQVNTDLRKLFVNLVPFPRLHFFACGYAPLTSLSSQCYCPMTVPELSSQLFDNKNMMCDCDPRRGVYLTASALFRGQISSQEVDGQMLMIQARNTSYFIEWIPSNIQRSICDIAPPGLQIAATFLGNTTAIRELFTGVDKQFSQLYARRSFVHWYRNEGLETVELDEARSNVTDLIQEYEMYEVTGLDEYSDDDNTDDDSDL